MKQSEALQWAKKIAQLIHSGSRKIERTTIKDQGLMATMSIMAAAQNQDIDALRPNIQEIVLFGSVARSADPDAEVGDIDLMVFDAGFYSNFISVELGEPMDADSGNEFLRRNLELLLEGWFGFSLADVNVQEVLEIPDVDLHVLPIAIFSDPHRQRAIASKHHDPHFLENAFSCMMRFDQATERFVPVDLNHLKGRHSGGRG